MFTARMQSPSCNVSLGGESNLGGQSMSIDFGQIRYGDPSKTDERYSRPLGIFFTGCNSAFKAQAQVTFKVNNKCSPDTACDADHYMGVRIKARANNAYINFGETLDMTLTGSETGYSAMYDLYLVSGDYYRTKTFELPIQIMVQYKWEKEE